MNFFSEKLPNFQETAKGTEIFIIRDERKVTVYDDFSNYPDSAANRWKLKVFNSENGFRYENICRKSGIYPTREIALAEIERIGERKTPLIFYLEPTEFRYDRKKFIWQSAESAQQATIPATAEEMQEEAKKRLLFLTGRSLKIDINLRTKCDDSYKRDAFATFCRARDSIGDTMLPFAFAAPDDYSLCILYVGGNKAEWQTERQGFNGRPDADSGYAPAFAYNYREPDNSEFGDIFYKIYRGHILRTA